MQQAVEESNRQSAIMAKRIAQLETEVVLLQGKADFIEAQQGLLFDRSPIDRDAMQALERRYLSRIQQLEDAFTATDAQKKTAIQRNALTAQRLEEAAALSAGAPESIRAFLHLQAAVLRQESDSVSNLPCLQAFLDASPSSYADSLASVLESIGMRLPTDIKKRSGGAPPPEDRVLKWCSDVFSQSTSPPMQSAESLNMAREMETMKDKLRTARMAQAETAAELQRELETHSKPAVTHKEVQTKVAFAPASSYLQQVQEMESMRKAARQKKSG